MYTIKYIPNLKLFASNFDTFKKWIISYVAENVKE